MDTDRIKTSYSSLDSLKSTLTNNLYVQTNQYKYVKSNSGEVKRTKFIKVFEIALIFIVTYVIVAFWETFFKNFFYKTLKMKEESTVHSFIICIVVTIALITAVYFTSIDGDQFVELENGKILNS